MNGAGSNVVGFFAIVAIFLSTIAFGILLVISCFRGFSRRPSTLPVVSAFFFMPLFLFSCFLAYAVIHSRLDVERNYHPPTQQEIWTYGINSTIADFYLTNPDAFDFPHYDDEAVSPRLLNYLSKVVGSRPNGFSIKDGKLISPFGDEVIIVIDQDGNNTLEARGFSYPYKWRNNVRQCALLRLDGNDSNRWSTSPGWLEKKPGVDYSSVK